MLQDRYIWEAEMQDGRIIRGGGSLAGAVRVSLMPAEGTGLPRHDFLGLKFVKRFMRVFHRSTVGGFDREAYFAEVERNVSNARLQARSARDAAGYFPSEPMPPLQPEKPRKHDDCLQVIIAKTCRIYVRCLDGSVLVTPPDYEVYL